MDCLNFREENKKSYDFFPTKAAFIPMVQYCELQLQNFFQGKEISRKKNWCSPHCARKANKYIPVKNNLQTIIKKNFIVYL